MRAAASRRARRTSGDVVAASGEPVHGPSGLLAMIAAVLTVGVGVAAVRAVLARRTSRR